MIPKHFIAEWIEVAPWKEFYQIEQDLIITKALLALYGHPYLKEAIAFRGGTALNKLFFNPPTRYSEDIDLVQIRAEPIGRTIDSIREVMDFWLGVPKREFSEGRVTLYYKTATEENFPLKLKIEINCREHFAVLGFQEYQFVSKSEWAAGKVNIKTYCLEELLGTKMRALYQRRKGRDLYDLYMALLRIPSINTTDILKCFRVYSDFVGQSVSRATFLANMELKLEHEGFRKDIISLLPKDNVFYEAWQAYELVREKLIDRL